MIGCRHFNGYKPCGKNEICDALCPSLSVPSTRLLVIHLEALGAVLRSTALLPAIKRKFPDSHITWVTQKPADQLLANNPFIDRVLTLDPEDLLALSTLEFDAAFCVDKGLKAAGVLRLTRADLVYGFTVEPRTGAVVPATEAAQELWQIGLNDELKFRVNTKSEIHLVREALELPERPRESASAQSCAEDDYVVRLTSAERSEAKRRRSAWLGSGRFLIGLNTGASGVIPAKKLTVEFQREIVRRLTEIPGVKVALLGGREDELRNQRISHGLDCVLTPTDRGLRDGLISVEACDAVISGDSLGMHMAIALKKWTVAWFGPTCAHEIELYGRGVKVLSKAPCGPCWKRSCDRPVMCYDLVAADEIINGVRGGLAARSAFHGIEGGIESAVGNGVGVGGNSADSDHSNGLRGRPPSRDSAPEASSTS